MVYLPCVIDAWWTRALNSNLLGQGVDGFLQRVESRVAYVEILNPVHSLDTVGIFGGGFAIRRLKCVQGNPHTAHGDYKIVYALFVGRKAPIAIELEPQMFNSGSGGYCIGSFLNLLGRHVVHRVYDLIAFVVVTPLAKGLQIYFDIAAAKRLRYDVIKRQRIVLHIDLGTFQAPVLITPKDSISHFLCYRHQLSPNGFPSRDGLKSKGPSTISK